MGKLTEHSELAKKNLVAIVMTSGALLMMMVFTLYSWIVLGFGNPLELFFEAMFLFVLVERAGGKYTYEVDKRVLRIVKRNFWGRITTYEVPYEDIMGVYFYKPQLIGVIKFRRTYRLHSALDRRNVWTIAFTVTDQAGKTENRRIYFKPSDVMLTALQEKLPGKVMVSEETVVINILKNEEKTKA
jgi:type IV secretory pathway TrbD component